MKGFIALFLCAVFLSCAVFAQGVTPSPNGVNGPVRQVGTVTANDIATWNAPNYIEDGGSGGGKISAPLDIGTPAFTDAAGTTALQATTSLNNYWQILCQNTSSGSSASCDLVLTADNGNATTHFSEFFENNSNGATAPFTNANAAGIYNLDNEFDIGALGASSPIVNIYAGGGTTAPVNQLSAALETTTTLALSTTANAGFYLPFSNPSALSTGKIVTGSNVPSGTQIALVSTGTGVISTTAPRAAPSGSNPVPVASTTGIAINMFVTDTTTAAGITNPSIVTAVAGVASELSLTSSGTSSSGQKVITVTANGTNCTSGSLVYDTTHSTYIPQNAVETANSATSVTISSNIVTNIPNADAIKCDGAVTLSAATPATGVALGDGLNFTPAVTLTQATTGNDSTGAVISFQNNATSLASNNVTVTGAEGVYGNLNVGGQITFGPGIGSGGGLSTLLVPLSDPTSLGIGYQALNVFNAASGIGVDTAVGYRALKLNTSGNNNTAVGYLADQSVTTGSNNTAVGTQANGTISTSGSSTAVGSLALLFATGGANTAIGKGSNTNTSSGTSNTSLGICMSGASNALTGSGNTCVGQSALSIITGGAANNVGLGNGAGASITTGSSNVVIGNSVASTTLTTGSSNILIGTSSALDATTSGATNAIGIGAGSVASNNTLIGISGTTTGFTAYGVPYFPNTASGALTSDYACFDTSNGEITYQTTNCTASLRALKDDIEELSPANALQEAMLLKPQTFYMKKEHNLGKQIGLIAEDVEAVDPKLAGHDPQTGKLQTVAYDRTGVLAIAAIQEQQREIGNLKMVANGHPCFFGILVCTGAR